MLKETEKVQFANPEMNMSVLSLSSVPRAMLDSHTVATADPLGRFALAGSSTAELEWVRWAGWLAFTRGKRGG